MLNSAARMDTQSALPHPLPFSHKEKGKRPLLLWAVEGWRQHHRAPAATPIAEAKAGESAKPEPASRRSLLRLAPRHKASLLIAFAASVSLHLAAFVILNGSGHSTASAGSRPADLAKTRLIVTIVQAEESSLPALTPSTNVAAQAGPSPEPANTMPAPATGILPAAALTLQERYFAASELDVIPKIQQDVELYPEELQHIRRGGKVVLSLWISETGEVEKIELVSSELPAIFAEVATQRFMQASFFPGKRNNSAVKSRVEAVLVFPSHDSVS